MTTVEDAPAALTGAELAEIRARADAATFGPWCWFGNTDVQNVYLATVEGGRRFVLQFRRWGTQGAKPMLQWPVARTLEDRHQGGCMEPVEKFVRYEVCPDAEGRHDERVYRADITGIRHPDAEFIAHAREDVPALLAEIDRLRALVGEDPIPQVAPAEYGGPFKPAPPKEPRARRTPAPAKSPRRGSLLARRAVPTPKPPRRVETVTPANDVL